MNARRPTLRWLIPIALACPLACSSNVPNRIDEISLKRTGAWLEGPRYEIVLRRDGSITYIGQQNVERIGTFEATVAASEFQQLEELIHRIDFFGISDDFNVPVDAAHIETSVLGEGKRRTIDDSGSGGPEGLHRLEFAIENVMSRVTDWKQVK